MRIRASGKPASASKTPDATSSQKVAVRQSEAVQEAEIIPLCGNKKTIAKKIETLKALEESRGVASYACKKVNISRETYCLWMRTDSEFARRAEATLETQIDYVEDKLLKKIEKNDTIAMLFYLKCKAKHRGYIEQTRVEHTGANGGAILTINGNMNIEKAQEEVTPSALRTIMGKILSGEATQFAGKFAPPVVNLPPSSPEEEQVA